MPLRCEPSAPLEIDQGEGVLGMSSEARVSVGLPSCVRFDFVRVLVVRRLEGIVVLVSLPFCFSNSDLRDDTGFCQETYQHAYSSSVPTSLTIEAWSVPLWAGLPIAEPC